MSFKITIGILLTGSIIRPRIIISTSIVTSRKLFLYHQFADQAVGETPRHSHLRVGTRFENARRISGEVQRLILRGAADPLAARPVITFNHYFKIHPDVLLIS